MSFLTPLSEAVQKKSWLPPLLIFTIALTVRFIYLFEAADNPIFTNPVVDAKTYDNIARGILGYRGLGKEFFRQGFLYPLFLAGAYHLSNGSILFAKILQAIIGSLTCVLTYMAGRRIFGSSSGIIAGLIVALYGPLIFFEADLLATGWATFWITALVLLFLVAESSPRTGWFFLLGISGILGILTRGPLLLPFCAGVVWLIIRFRARGFATNDWLRFLALPLGFALIALPVAMKCHEVTGKFTILPSQSGLNLYIGNNPDRMETVNARPGPAWEDILLKPYEKGDLDLWEYNEYFIDRVYEYIRSNPGHFLKGMIAKTYEFFNTREFPRNYDVYQFRDWSILLSILMWKIQGFGFPFGIVLPLAVIGYWVHRRQAPLLLPLFIGSYAVTIVLVFVSGRYRAPLIPVFAIPAGAGLLYLIDTVGQRRYKTFTLFLIIMAGVLFSTSFPKHLAVEGDPVEYRLEIMSFEAEKARRSNDPDKALTILEYALRISPNDAPTLIHLGVLLVSDFHDYARAEDVLVRALEIAPNSATALTFLGTVRFLTGDYQGAIEPLTKAIQRNPKNSPAYINLGNTYIKTEQNDLAIQMFQKAVEINPWDANSLYNIAALHSQTGNISEAKKYLLSAKETAEKIGDQLLLDEIGKAPQLSEIPEPTEKQTKPLKSVPLRRVVPELPSQYYADTLENLYEMLQKDPGNTWAMTRIATIHLRSKNYKKADTMIDQLLNTSPDKFQGYYLQGKSLQGQNKKEEALNVFIKAREFAQGKEARFLELAKVHMSLDDFKGTREMLAKTLELTEKPGSVHYMFGVAYRKEGKSDKAIEHYEKAIEFEPEHLRALNDLAVLYVQANSHIEKAVELAELAYKLSDKHPRFADAYGWVLTRAGKAEQAIPILEEAAKALPNEQIIQIHLTEARALAKQNTE